MNAALTQRLSRLPLLKAAVLFAAGVALSGIFTLPLWFLTGVFVCSGVGALLLRSQVGVAVLLLCMGFASAQLRHRSATTPLGVVTDYAITVEGIPANRGHYFSADGVVTAWCDPSDGVWHAAEDRILLRSDSLTPLYGGERIVCCGAVRQLKGGADSFRQLMAQRGVIGSIFITHRTPLVRTPSGGSLHLHAAERMQRLGLRGDADAVVRAMTAGDRSAITPTLRATYSRSGFAHLLAVSGLHTGIVFAIVNLALWWLPLLRRGHIARNIIVVVLVWIFVLAAGASPSAVRAAVMCSFLQFSLAAASEYSSLNALGGAALGMLMWRPAWLGDASFQLSLLAVTGILVWGVPLCRLLKTRWRPLNYLNNALLISFAASVATMPLACHLFGIIPLAGVIINPIAIALATVVVAVGALWLVAPIPTLAAPLASAIQPFVDALNALAHRTAELPYGSLDYSLDGGVTAAIYLLFVAVTLYIWSLDRKKSVHLPYDLSTRI